MKKRVLAAAIAAMCFVGTVPVSVVPIAGVAENLQEQTVLTENDDAVTTTIAVTETKPVTTITMPVLDDLTLLKGTKDMTLNDVMRLAEIGDELDWADFDNYNGKIMPVDAWVNGWHFDLGNDFSLEVLGNPPDKPEIVRLYHYDFDNGIDIRTNDVKEYIASTATPVNSTDLQGTKNMTINDVIELAKKGDELNWSDFDEYVGKDGWHGVGMYTHTCSFELGDGYVLYVGGNQPTQPETILLYRNDPKSGIDIRTDDVKEYIASKAIDSDETDFSGITAIVEPEKAKELFNKYFKENNVDAECIANETYPDYHSPLVVEYVLETGTINGKQIVEFAEKNNIERTLFRVVPIINGERVYKVNAIVNVTITEPEEALRIFNKYFKDNNIDAECVKNETYPDYHSPLVVEYVLETGTINGKQIVEFAEKNNIERTLFRVVPIINGERVYKVNADINLSGDTNCDGSVDMADAVMIMQALANPNKYGIDGTAEHHLTEQGKLNGDMDGNGLTVGDAQAIQRKLLGIVENEALVVKLSTFMPPDADYIELKPDEPMVSSYDPILNSIDGVGVWLEFAPQQSPVTLTADKGSFKVFTYKNGGLGTVDEVGKTYELDKSGSVSWVPETLIIPDGYEEKIQIKGSDNGKSVDLGTLVITKNPKSSDGVFCVTLKKPESSDNKVQSSADYPCAIKINGTVFWQTDEGVSEDFSNYTINKVTAYSENGTPQNDGESNFDRRCTTEYIILDEKTIVVNLQDGLVGYWIFRAK